MAKRKPYEPIFIRSANNYDFGEVSDETALVCKDPHLAQQQFKEESDINFIGERYGIGNPDMPTVPVIWGAQYDHIFDFQSAENAVIETRKQFMQLPAKTRAHFDNDPGALLAFLDNPENRREAILLGLVKDTEEAPQPPKGDAAAKGGGETPAPPPAAPAKPAKRAPTDNTET